MQHPPASYTAPRHHPRHSATQPHPHARQHSHHCGHLGLVRRHARRGGGPGAEVGDHPVERRDVRACRRHDDVTVGALPGKRALHHLVLRTGLVPVLRDAPGSPDLHLQKPTWREALTASAAEAANPAATSSADGRAAASGRRAEIRSVLGASAHGVIRAGANAWTAPRRIGSAARPPVSGRAPRPTVQATLPPSHDATVAGVTVTGGALGKPTVSGPASTSMPAGVGAGGGGGGGGMA